MARIIRSKRPAHDRAHCSTPFAQAINHLIDHLIALCGDLENQPDRFTLTELGRLFMLQNDTLSRLGVLLVEEGVLSMETGQQLLDACRRAWEEINEVEVREEDD